MSMLALKSMRCDLCQVPQSTTCDADELMGHAWEGGCESEPMAQIIPSTPL